jgi:hypothetical protein
MLLLRLCTIWDDVGSFGFSLHTFPFALFSAKFCEATWFFITHLPASALSDFDVDLLSPRDSLVSTVIWLMELQNCSENIIFQAKVE